MLVHKNLIKDNYNYMIDIVMEKVVGNLVTGKFSIIMENFECWYDHV